MSRPELSIAPPPSEGLGAAAAQVARGLARPSLAPIRLAAIAAGVEGLVLSVTFWFVQYAATPGTQFHPGMAGLAGIGMAMLALGLTAAFGGFALRVMVNARRSLPRTLPGYLLALVAMGVAGLGHILPGGVFWAGLTAFGVVLVPLRYCLSLAADWAVASGLTARRAVLAGGGPEAERLVRGLSEKTGNEVRICGIFDDRTGKRAPDVVLDVPKIGSFDDLVQFCRMAEIDLIILCLPPTAEERIAQLLEKFRVLPVPVHLSAFSQDFSFADAPDGTALLPATFRAERRLAKRVFDLTLGASMLVCLAPVMLAVAVAIRLDSRGPIFFRQQRHGFNDSLIRVWKFRTMYADQCDARGSRIVTRGDPRVTRVGRILRKTSLDELPQLFNVLEGSLSLVGPRPHAVDARSSRQERFAQIVQGYSARHRLPPGITGWAQIHGWRGEVDDPESLRHRFAHDLFYIENWSLWLDLAILLRTPLSLLDTRRAY
ncbi:exopolysaccharide biosynthesis polyprenyl glycosylphosphotransferase [Fluviibacterium sp. DFM31]|uniref:Exopolysaccharide biosynthesis polyprenyl glycosylphosphotransferase n=1 Tax=Meridianimarinicoccus marinus TaxID=3231483 RepID=A0ABV3L5P5_9RHOB